MAYFSYDEKKVFYQEKGNGPLLIILPGNTATSVAHENELNYFSSRYHVAALDFLGTGQSDRLDEWSVDWWDNGGKQVSRLIEHLGYSEAVLIGISGGGIIAMSAATNYPNQIKAVIADSFSLELSENILLQDLISERENYTEDQVYFWKAMQGDDWQEVVRQDTDMIKQTVEKGGSCIKGSPSDIKCPVLITFSRKDHFYPKVEKIADGLNKQIKNCQVYLDDEGGHPLIWTKNQIFLTRTDEFLMSIK